MTTQAIVDGEIRDLKARLKKLAADEQDAADRMEDTRWRAIQKAMRAARENLDQLETKRAEIMAGIFVEPVAEAAKQPGTLAEQYLSDAGRSAYYADETVALKSMGLDAKARELPFTYGAFAVFYKHLEGALHGMRDRIEELEACGIKYMGVYQRAGTYGRGSVVTHLGSAWIAIKDADVGVAPQDSPDIWQMMVKRGRDGKDRT